MDGDFLQGRIDATKATIVAYEDAILKLGSGGGIQSYTLDTAQSKQTVTRADIPRLHVMVTSLYNQLATLQARQTGSVTIGGPAW